MIHRSGIARYGGTTWLPVTLRKSVRCVVCSVAVYKGSSAYRPLEESSRFPRYMRLCVKCAAKPIT